MLDKARLLGSIHNFIFYFFFVTCVKLLNSHSPLQLNNQYCFLVPSQGAPSTPEERGPPETEARGLLRRCWRSEPGCPLPVGFLSGSGVSTVKQRCLGGWLLLGLKYQGTLCLN